MPAPTPVGKLTDEEKAKVRYYLGYPVTSVMTSISLGVYVPIQASFLVERSLDLLTSDYACEQCRAILRALDCIEIKILDSTDSVVTEKVGDIALHPNGLATDNLEGEYRRWAFRLAELLGVPIYPYADRFKKLGPGKNVRVK